MIAKLKVTLHTTNKQCTKSAQQIMRIKKAKKISKGYRLKPETHRLIDKIQKMIKSDYDQTLAVLCTEYLKNKNYQQK